MNKRFLLNLSDFDNPCIEYCIASSAGKGKNLRLFVRVEGNVVAYRTELNGKPIYAGDSSRDAAIAFNDALSAA